MSKLIASYQSHNLFYEILGLSYVLNITHESFTEGPSFFATR